MPDLDAHTINLGQLFSQEYFFRVPVYQRPFRWDADNLSDLINDLLNAPRDREYFMGTLVLHSQSDSSFDIVDGQQRLTALCILLACIRDMPALDDDLGFRAELHEKVVQPEKKLDGVPARNRIEVRDQAIFNRMVATPGGTRNPEDPETDDSSSVKRFLLARDIFLEVLDTLSSGQIKELAGFVSQQCVMIFLATDSFDHAFRLFTVVNDRGEQLRRIDILKAENLAPDVITSDTSRARYAQGWENMEEELGEKAFEDVFSLLRLMYVRDKPQADLLTEFQDRIFGKPGMPKIGTDFLDTLKRFVELYDQIFVQRDFLEETDDHARFATLMSAMESQFAASEWKSCVLAFADKFGRQGFWPFVLALEKVYLEHWVGGVRKDERYSTYTSLLTEIANCSSGEDAVAAVTYDGDAISQACERSNFYTSGFAKYLLLRAEILASELDHPKAFVVRSIEHVLPQTPGDDSAWRDHFSEEEIEELVHKAGNLVLLSKSKNSAASNREFDQKKETYLKNRVSDFPRSIQVLGIAEWSPEVIRERTIDFASSILDDP